MQTKRGGAGTCVALPASLVPRRILAKPPWPQLLPHEFCAGTHIRLAHDISPSRHLVSYLWAADDVIVYKQGPRLRNLARFDTLVQEGGEAILAGFCSIDPVGAG